MTKPSHDWVSGDHSAAPYKVLTTDDPPRSAAGENLGDAVCPRRSAEMPRTATDLSTLLADDAVVCVRRPAKRASASEAVTLRSEDPPGDPELARVVDAWPTLPPDVHDAILAMIESASDFGEPRFCDAVAHNKSPSA